MSVAAQAVTEDDGPLSPWWIRGALIVMVFGCPGTCYSSYSAPCHWSSHRSRAMSACASGRRECESRYSDHEVMADL